MYKHNQNLQMLVLHIGFIMVWAATHSLLDCYRTGWKQWYVIWYIHSRIVIKKIVHKKWMYVFKAFNSHLFQTFCRDVDAQIVEIQTNEENNFLKNYLLHNHKNGMQKNLIFIGFFKKNMKGINDTFKTIYISVFFCNL